MRIKILRPIKGALGKTLELTETTVSVIEKDAKKKRYLIEDNKYRSWFIDFKDAREI